MQTSHNQEGIPLSDINSGRRWIVARISIQHWWMMYWLSCPVILVWIAWALVWLLTCRMEKWDVLSWQYSLDTSLTYLRREKKKWPKFLSPSLPLSLFPHLQTSMPFRLIWRLGCPLFLSVSVGLDLFRCNVHAMQCKWSCHSRRPNHYGRTTLTSRQQGGRQCVHQTLASYRRQIGQLASVAK